MYRNHNCGELTIKNVGEEVVLAGWIQRIRNLGSMKFIDLRDQFGITQIVILGKCKSTLPFEVNSEKADINLVKEDLRLEYRFLDLRNEKLHNTILLRSKILKTLRDKMDELGFSEIQTPILANSSPEGARDYLVPSRLHP